ncbi:metal transporter [Candidatus Gracilibacteria bacterium]|nr:metal transporter [Candidatus Gracilibacteria bacterium]
MNKNMKFLMAFLLPIVFAVVLVWGFFEYGPLGVFEADAPPVEILFIERAVFSPEHIELKVFNDGPEPVTVAQAVINEVIWQFEMIPSNTLQPLETGYVAFDYPWIEGDPLAFTLMASDGVTFEKEVDVAFTSPVFSMRYVKTFVALGIYVGVIPVLLGLLWFPFLRRLRGKGYSFLLSLTIGLLLFLGVDTFAEALELIGDLPDALNGVGILLIGFMLAIFVLGAISYKIENRAEVKGDHFKALTWGYLISLGIGLHNLGEGLAIGSAYALGEVALGATLVVGFMAHNLTEGIAIISPLTKDSGKISRFFMHLVMMGLLAGAPTIIGTLIGGFAYSAVYGVFFLAVGAGAIFDVTYDIANHMAKGKWNSLFTMTNVFGIFLGLLLMYFTGVLVLG